MNERDAPATKSRLSLISVRRSAHWFASVLSKQENGMIRKALAVWTIALGLLAICAFQAPAEARTGSVRIVIYKAGFIVGVSGGRGTLVLAGKQYPLRIGGVSLGATIGASRAELVGNAYNLVSPADIAGTYTAVEASVAVAGGGKVARLRNSRGVVLEVQGRQIGAMFSIDLSGMEIRIGR
jgi:hypothetical protein